MHAAAKKKAEERKRLENERAAVAAGFDAQGDGIDMMRDGDIMKRMEKLMGN